LVDEVSEPTEISRTGGYFFGWLFGGGWDSLDFHKNAPLVEQWKASGEGGLRW